MLGGVTDSLLCILQINSYSMVPGIYGSKQLLFTVNTSVHVQVFTVTVYVFAFTYMYLAWWQGFMAVNRPSLKV